MSSHFRTFLRPGENEHALEHIMVTEKVTLPIARNLLKMRQLGMGVGTSGDQLALNTEDRGYEERHKDRVRGGERLATAHGRGGEPARADRHRRHGRRRDSRSRSADKLARFSDRERLERERELQKDAGAAGGSERRGDWDRSGDRGRDDRGKDDRGRDGRREEAEQGAKEKKAETVQAENGKTVAKYKTIYLNPEDDPEAASKTKAKLRAGEGSGERSGRGLIIWERNEEDATEGKKSRWPFEEEGGGTKSKPGSSKTEISLTSQIAQRMKAQDQSAKKVQRLQRLGPVEARQEAIDPLRRDAVGAEEADHEEEEDEEDEPAQQTQLQGRHLAEWNRVQAALQAKQEKKQTDRKRRLQAALQDASDSDSQEAGKTKEIVPEGSGGLMTEAQVKAMMKRDKKGDVERGSARVQKRIQQEIKQWESAKAKNPEFWKPPKFCLVLGSEKRRA